MYLELLFRARAEVLQWRDKDLEEDELRAVVRAGVHLARKTQKIFLVNSRLDLAMEEGADGVHLTADQDTWQAVDLRQSLHRTDFIVGKSVHSIREALAEESGGADYVLLAPIFDPLSKAPSRSLIGLAGLREAVQMLTIPVVALGGIETETLDVVFSTGVAGAAGISWLHEEMERLLESGD